MLALPWMESISLAASRPVPAMRMAFFYVPIGVVRRGFFPGEETAVIPKGNLFKISDISWVDNKVGHQPLRWTSTLSPLEKVQDKVTLITGMDRTFQIGTDVHAQCASCFLSSAEPFSMPSFHRAYPIPSLRRRMVWTCFRALCRDPFRPYRQCSASAPALFSNQRTDTT